MLYDNALLLRVYLHWWRATGESARPRGSRWRPPTSCSRELRTAEGGFASSLDADTRRAGDGRALLRVDARPAASRCSATTDGAWAATLLRGHRRPGTFEHGASVLQLRADPDDRGALGSASGRALLGRASRRPQPGPRRQGRGRLERAGDRRAGRGRCAAASAATWSTPRSRAPTCSSTSTGTPTSAAGAGLPGRRGRARTRRGARGLRRRRRGPARAVPATGEARWLTSPAPARRCARPVRRRHRRVLRHRRRRRPRWCAGRRTRPTA